MACNSINSSIEIFTIALLCILSVSVLLKKKKSKRERLFLAVLVLHMTNTLGDLAAWRFAGQPGAFAFVMTRAGNFTTYSIGIITYLFFLMNVYAEISRNDKMKKVGKLITGCICFLTLINFGLLLYNLQSGIIFTLDQNNIFTWGPYCEWPDNIVLIQLLVLLPLIFLQSRYSVRKTMLLYSLYAGPPIFAILLENWYPVLMLIYPAIAISLLLMYVNMQQEQEKLLLKKELELSDSRVKLLLGQIQPHFIFNSLLAIQELCTENPVKAEETVKAFAKYLRGNLDAMSCNHLITFEKELEHIRHYLALEMTDPASKLQVEYHLEVTDFMVPALSIQPIVENAVQHGIGTRSEGGNVLISSHRRQNGIEVIVQDDGVGFESATKKQQERLSIGIENVRTRLASQCGGSLNIQSGEEGTIVTITFPKEDTNEYIDC